MSLFFFDTFGGLRALLYPPTMSCGSRIYRLRRDGRRKAEMTEGVDRRVLLHGHTDASLAETVAALHRRLRVAGDRPDATVLELLDLVDALASFPFGRFLLQNRGWNGFWTDFVMTHPERGRSTGTAPDGRRLTLLERQLLDTFPTVLATQQRSRHFARVIQAHIRDNVRLASCPSGLMRDLLARDYRGRCGVTLIGIDIDEESLAAAARLADAYGLARASSARTRGASPPTAPTISSPATASASTSRTMRG